MVIMTKPTHAAKHKNKNRKNTELKAWADTTSAYKQTVLLIITLFFFLIQSTNLI